MVPVWGLEKVTHLWTDSAVHASMQGSASEAQARIHTHLFLLEGYPCTENICLCPASEPLWEGHSTDSPDTQWPEWICPHWHFLGFRVAQLHAGQGKSALPLTFYKLPIAPLPVPTAALAVHLAHFCVGRSKLWVHFSWRAER